MDYVFKMLTLTFPIYPPNIFVKTEHQNVTKKQKIFHYGISYLVKKYFYSCINKNVYTIFQTSIINATKLFHFSLRKIKLCSQIPQLK